MTHTHPPLRPGDVAPDWTVSDSQGQTHQLSDTWRTGPVLLNFIRHFGWIFCREWLAQLEQHHEALAAAGLKVVVVGIGQPKHAAHYGPRRAPHATCLVTGGTEAHTAYGLQRGGLLQLAGLQMIKAGLRATAEGFQQGAATGDTRMLSGAFIIDPPGVVRYAFYSDYAGHLPDWDELIRQAAAREPSWK